MTERDQSRDAERLPEDAVRRVFARAGELEAERGAELSVAELRDAARDAGIAPAAFEQALAELHPRHPAVAAGPVPTQLRRLAWLWPVAAVAVALLAIFVLRMLFPAV